MSDDLKQFIEKLATEAGEDISLEVDFVVYDYSGSNVDDAYELGQEIERRRIGNDAKALLERLKDEKSQS